MLSENAYTLHNISKKRIGGALFMTYQSSLK